MRKIYHSLFCIVFLFAFSSLSAQITGVKNIPVDYLTIQAAVADLNLQGVGVGGATINVPASHGETLTAQMVLTFTSNAPSAANPLVIRKNGSGLNPQVTAFSPGVSTTVDGIFILSGCDYVTIDGIDLMENIANTTSTQLMEWGYALLKPSGVDGCQYNTVKNSSVTLSNTNTNSKGIYIGNHIVANTTGLIVTNISGTSSNNKFYNNSIQNAYMGYSFTGYGSAAPYDFYDQNNIIGVDGISTRRSQVVKFGGGAVQANGIIASNQNGLKIHSTYINNNGAPNSTSIMYGIILSGGTNSNLDVYGDTITLALNSAIGGQLMGISCAMGGSGAGNSVSIHNNLITGCTYPTNSFGTFRAIENTATSSFRSIYSNSITNNSIPGTGEFSAIYESNNSPTLVLSLKIYSNTVSGNTKTGTSGVFNCIYGNASANQLEIYNNQAFNNNAAASSGAFYGYYNIQFPINEYIHDNNFYNNTSGTGEHVAIYARAGSGPTNKEIYGNNIYNNTGSPNATSVGGIWADFGTVVNVYRNRVYNLTNNTAAGITPAVYGINIGASNNIQCSVNNNYVSELKTPNASNVNASYGIWLQGSVSSFIGAYFNTVYLNATSTGGNFGSAALVCGINALSYDLRSNALVNASTPNGTGSTKALVRGNTTLTNYDLLSGYNCLYAGTPGPANLVYYDGTNSLQTVQAFKNLVGPREQASFSELPPFNNVASSPYDLHISNAFSTQCEAGGTPVGFLSVDYDFHVRNPTTPDVGADEFAGIFQDNASPNIQYPLLANSPVATNKIVSGWATITDPSNINTTIGTRPRLYYKKSTEANAYVGNTVLDNGWKYVEATNASSPFSFNINYALLFTGGNVVAGDIIQYFVTAQDLAAPVHVGLNNGGFAVQPANVNLGAAQFPLGNTINQYNIVTNMYSGTLNVGPTETVTSLTNPGGMFDLINQGVLSGNTTLNITGDLTLETGAIALNQWAEDGAGNYSLTIQPSAAVTRSITGSCTVGSLVRFNGADRVNIDGRFNNAGTWLLFRNVGQHSSVGYVNDAQNNILQYSIIESGNQLNTTTAGGAVIIGTTSATNGNDNITIANCEIRDRSDVPGNFAAWGINVSGTNLLLSQYNNNIVIKNNNIHDYFINGNFAHGIVVTTGVSYCNISNNSLYQTTAKSHTTTSGGSMRGIFITQASAVNTSGGFTVTNNYIGGNAPLAAGDMTLSVVGPTVYQSFLGLLVTTGQIPNYVEGNIIRGIDFTTNSPTVALSVFIGMQAGNGIHSIGTQTGNVIGAATGTGAIKINFNAAGAANAFIAGILSAPVNGYFDMRNNTVGGISMNGTSGAGLIVPQWIQHQGTPAQGCNISNNLIGSTSTASSIINNVNAPTVAFALRHLITTGAALTCLSNTIQNITDNSNSASSQHYGMLMIGTVGNSGVMNISNNVLKNISSNAFPLAFTFVNYGIACQGMAGTHTIEANTISGLSCVNTGVGGGSAVGIQTQGGTCGGYMRRNYINNLTNVQTGVGAGIAGVSLNSGNTWELSNNMISINNSAYTNTIDVIGVVDLMGQSSNLNFHYNTVYIGGGSPTGTLNSYAFYRGGTTTLNMRNNLLYNERSGATATHVAIGTATNANWSGVFSNYNAFLTLDTTKLAIWSGTVTNFTGWKGFTLGDNNSQKNITTTITSSALFVSAFLGDLHIGTSVYPGGLGTPISIGVDIDNNGRSATLPAVGADEIPCPAPVVSVVSQTNVTCNGGNNGAAIVTATGGINWTYTWTPTASTSQTLTNLAAGNYSVSVSNNCSLTTVLTVSITEPSTITPNASFTQPLCNGGNNGSATITASGGTPGYTYSWTPSSSTSSVANGLSAGVQNFTVTDSNSCTATGSINVTEPTAVFATGSSTSACGTQSNGAVTASVSGGTPGYTYSWSPNVSTTSVAVNLVPGSYTFQATDANGCTSASLPFIVGSNPVPTVAASSSTNLICQGSTAVLTSTASANVTYSWSSGGNTSSVIVSPSVTTIYTITVTFSTGCSSTAQVTQSVSPCTGLAKLTGNAGIQTFPNPSSGQLFVTYYGFTQGASVEIYNTLGQLLVKKEVESLTTEISLNNYANGLYIVKVLNSKGHVEQVTKLIKE
jgi:hypothetical protein